MAGSWRPRRRTLPTWRTCHSRWRCRATACWSCTRAWCRACRCRASRSTTSSRRARALARRHPMPVWEALACAQLPGWLPPRIQRCCRAGLGECARMAGRACMAVGTACPLFICRAADRRAIDRRHRPPRRRPGAGAGGRPGGGRLARAAQVPAGRGRAGGGGVAGAAPRHLRAPRAAAPAGLPPAPARPSPHALHAQRRVRM